MADKYSEGERLLRRDCGIPEPEPAPPTNLTAWQQRLRDVGGVDNELEAERERAEREGKK